MSAEPRQRSNPAERSFVVQFRPDGQGAVRAPFRGRVEHVASGRTADFRSLRELPAVLAALLREQANAAER